MGERYDCSTGAVEFFKAHYNGDRKMKLLVIDIQKGITDSRLYNFESFIENTKKIIKAARDNHIEVIYFQHDDGPGTGFSIGDDDFEIASQVAPMDGATAKGFIYHLERMIGAKSGTLSLFSKAFKLPCKLYNFGPIYAIEFDQVKLKVTSLYWRGKKI